MVYRLRLCASNIGGMGLIPGELRSHTLHSKIKRKKKNYIKLTLVDLLAQELVNFSVKDQIANIFVFVGHMASVTTLNFCHYSAKAATESSKQMGMPVPTKLNSQKQASGWIWPKDCSMPTLVQVYVSYYDRGFTYIIS